MTDKEFKEYVRSWADKIGVSHQLKEIHLRYTKHKIASCSSKGRLTFNKDVLNFPKEEIDKIVVHELLHLRYKNHGRLFKAMYSLYLNQKPQY